ncbi:MAG: CDP-alcohol phosphatidyltransferase family protein, partial [Dehalococcoidales bacterium]|nr:CDP-alcohol phosphatidyltransferase family protein [Dehalococcoidales bacterium]
ISEPMARLLAKTKVTPNQTTWAAFGIALLSFVSFVLGYNIIAGLLVQLSSIVDGIDGSLARLKGKTSEFGGFLDSVLDRYADILIVLGLTLWSLSHETYPGIWLAGMLAITGIICISYTRARISPNHRHLFDTGFKSLASRDIRLFLIMLGAVIGQAYFCLVVIAVLTNAVVFYRLIYMYRYLGQKDNRSKPSSQSNENL